MLTDTQQIFHEHPWIETSEVHLGLSRPAWFHSFQTRMNFFTIILPCSLHVIKFCDHALAGVAGLWARSPVGGVQEATDLCFSSPLSPSLPLSLKIKSKKKKKIPWLIIEILYLQLPGPSSPCTYSETLWFRFSSPSAQPGPSVLPLRCQSSHSPTNLGNYFYLVVS